jgi:hypothetical protein
MVENIAYELVPGLTLPGQRTMQKVRIEPSVASPSSPLKGPELPISGVPWLPISREVMGRRVREVPVELTRFRGHQIPFWGRGVHDGPITSPIPC